MTPQAQVRGDVDVLARAERELAHIEQRAADIRRFIALYGEFSAGPDDAEPDSELPPPVVVADVTVEAPEPESERPPRIASHLNFTRTLADVADGAGETEAPAADIDAVLARYPHTQRLMLRDPDGAYLHMTCAAMTPKRELAWQGTKTQLRAVIRKYPATAKLRITPVMDLEPVKINGF